MSSLCSVSSTRVRLAWRLALLLALTALVALALGGEIGQLQSGVLTLAPAVGLAVMMLTRPYLGQRAIARLRGARRARRSTVARWVAVSQPFTCVARGGRLIGVALAGRAPPLVLAGR